MKSKYVHLLITLFSIFILKLYFNDTLIFYVHPRYVVLTLLSAIIAFTVNFFGILRSLSTEKLNKTEVLKDFTIIGVILLGLFIPAKPISTSFASGRDIETNLTVQQSLVDESAFESKLDFESQLIKTKFGGDLQDNSATFTISGFVQYRDNLPENSFLLTRYVMTCCAVDARPFGVVVLTNPEFNIETDTWVEVTGQAIESDINNQSTIVIQAEDVIEADEVFNPYTYK